MKKQSTNRQYNFPDADLYLLCMEKIKFAHRDIKHFEQYAYSKNRLSGFLNQCNKFRALPDDDELLGDQMVLTEKKKEAAEKLKAAIRSIMTRVEMKYNNRTGRYRKFGTSKMGDMSDAQLLFCGRRVIRVARAQMDFLADVGLSDKNIQRVADSAQVFENALNFQQDKISDRDIAVEKRVELGNKLYEELIVLCNIGKDVWAETDFAKYENYVIYESNNEQKKARKLREAQEDKK